MNRDNQPWWPVTAATIDWSDDGDPISNQFGDVYYSRENGLAESEHVFLRGNDLPRRWQNLTQDTFCIGETGFGTGLNFLLSWQLWRQLPQPRPRLHYLSIEKFPLRREDMQRALASWPELAPLSRQLLLCWPDLLPGQHRLILEGGQLTLDLWWEDVGDALPDLASHGPMIDAWYLDGFAPARNESMWQPALYDAMATLSRPGASFATFTAAGHVRRGLQEAGFKVEKAAGFGRKRECLRGTLARPGIDPGYRQTPWDLDQSPPSPADSALIIGAGLAGCTTAAALARRGISVTLLDAGELAGAASGNEQGILYTRLSKRHSALTDFALQSVHFAAALYRQMFASGELRRGEDGELCGSFQLQANEDELAILEERLATAPELAVVLQADAAQALLGVRPPGAGYWYPGSGWLNPPSLCRALVERPGITLLENCGELSLGQGRGQWQALREGKALAEAPLVIVCAGVSAAGFPGLEWLPLQAIRGQTSHIPCHGGSADLKAAFCHEGYIAPARNGSHCIGATFELRATDTALRGADHRHNLDKLAAALPQWQAHLEAIDIESLSGRVGFRCASPDYLPVAGPVPDRESFLQTYAGLRKNARHTIFARGNYMQGLYVNTAHGSRGLTSTPLVAEVLASRICAQAPPLSRELLRALSPARFLVRDLARNRI
jgi:tRNA 5-methylaminomethyl-2-thiouridine biosynthesis bifunctional protein